MGLTETFSTLVVLIGEGSGNFLTCLAELTVVTGEVTVIVVEIFEIVLDKCKLLPPLSDVLDSNDLIGLLGLASPVAAVKALDADELTLFDEGGVEGAGFSHTMLLFLM